jgi:hypothetical protein
MWSWRIAGAVLVATLNAACVAPAPGPSERPVAVASPSASPGATTASAPTTSLLPAPSLAEPSGQPAAVEPSVGPGSTPEPQPPVPSLPPALGWPRLAGVTSTWQGGCGSLYDGTKIYGADQCGPFPFDRLISSVPTRVLAGARLVVRPPDGAAFSVVRADLPGEWTISIARAAELAGSNDGQSFPTGIGTILAHGRGPDTAVVITMPNRAGDYVVQVDGPLERDGWTFTEGVYFWLVRTV